MRPSSWARSEIQGLARHVFGELASALPLNLLVQILFVDVKGGRTTDLIESKSSVGAMTWEGSSLLGEAFTAKLSLPDVYGAYIR